MSGGSQFQLEATVRVALAKGLGPRLVCRLRQALGDDVAICAAGAGALAEVEGIGLRRAQSLQRALAQAPVAAELAATQSAGVELVPDWSDQYPPLLNVINDPPPLLWVRGALPGPAEPALAIVGSRRCTAYGRQQAMRLAGLLAQSGLIITSGGALGIDGAAHAGALAVEGLTMAVVGSGHDHCYPPEHRALFDRIVRAGGAVLSEYPMGLPPRPGNFPRRNRIISGLSLGVLVIEAARGSGALITARLAAEDHGREVMVLPGRVDSPASAGCLQALRDGWAAVVISHADVLEQLNCGGLLLRGALMDAGYNDPEGLLHVQPRLTEDQSAILGILKQSDVPVLLDQLAARTGIPLNQLMADLTMLQIQGRVQRGGDGVRLGC